MVERNQNVTQYLVPANVSAKFEFFPGFGWYELKIVVIACLIGLIIFFGLGVFKKTIYIDTNELSMEMSMGVDESGDSQEIINEDGFIEKKEPIIPTMYRLIIIIMFGFGSFFLVKRDPSSDMSLMFIFKSSSEFKKKQKLYLYRYNSGTEE